MRGCGLRTVDRREKPVYTKGVMQPTYQALTVLDLVPFGQTEGGSLFFALRLERPDWKEWHPGQFVMLRPVSFGQELPWARPFSICHMTSRHLICFFKNVGRGTEKLARLRGGDTVMAWGPLGSYFEVETAAPTLLLAGGMGIAPFVGYVSRHPQPWNMAMLFGHRDPIGCFPVDSINDHIPVDSLRETVPGDLDNMIYSMQERIRDCAEQGGLILACGPMPFLRTAKKFAAEFHGRLQISVEQRMGCGVGACLGCVCKTTSLWPVEAKQDKYVRSCVEGPVFWASQIDI